MNRFFKILVHLVIIAVGIPVVGFSNFWAWDLFRGLFLPIVATGFFIYLLLFIALGGYRAFQSTT